MLNSIKSTYCYKTAFSALSEWWDHVAYSLKSRVFGPRKAIAGRDKAKLPPPNQFICSGLVQLGFLNVVTELAAMQKLAPERLADVVFREDLARFLPGDWEQFTEAERSEILADFCDVFQDFLQAVTPEHLATTPRLKWVYIVRGGEVHPVQSELHARQLLSWDVA
jgi:hypothetical protein